MGILSILKMQNGLTWEQMKNITGRSLTALLNYESKGRKIPEEVYDRLSIHFGISKETLKAGQTYYTVMNTRSGNTVYGQEKGADEMGYLAMEEGSQKVLELISELGEGVDDESVVADTTSDYETDQAGTESDTYTSETLGTAYAPATFSLMMKNDSPLDQAEQDGEKGKEENASVYYLPGQGDDHNTFNVGIAGPALDESGRHASNESFSVKAETGGDGGPSRVELEQSVVSVKDNAAQSKGQNQIPGKRRVKIHQRRTANMEQNMQANMQNKQKENLKYQIPAQDQMVSYAGQPMDNPQHQNMVHDQGWTGSYVQHMPINGQMNGMLQQPVGQMRSPYADSQAGFLDMYIQSQDGQGITVGRIYEKVLRAAPLATVIYVKPDDNRAYWTGDGVMGNIKLWD